MLPKGTELATYATAEYSQLLATCVIGCRNIWDTSPIIYTDSADIQALASTMGCECRMIEMHTFPHVTSLEILRSSPADVLLMIDADCWPLSKKPLDAVLVHMADPECAFSGHIGSLDIPYLFRGIKGEPFSALRSVLRSHPRFAQLWLEADETIGGTLNTGCVVNVPLLYGGFAGYRPRFFSKMDIPSWVYSADIWSSIFAIENDLLIRHAGDWHFQQNLDGQAGLCHWIGHGLDFAYPIEVYRKIVGEASFT